MSLADAMAPAEAHYRNVVMHDTWGHLMAECGVYEGRIVIARGIYYSGSMMVVDSKIDGFQSSPWWFQALEDFQDTLRDSLAEGSVAEYEVLVTVRDEEEPVPEDFHEWHREDQEYWKPKVERVFIINVQRVKVLVEPL